MVNHVLKKCQVKPQHLNWVCLNRANFTKEHLEIFDDRFKGLHVLQLRHCRQLHMLPSSISGLTSSKELD